MRPRVLAGLLFTALLAAAQAAVYYVDDVGGNDANGGMSPAAAWKSVARVNAGPYLAGDRILFRRGGVWREELSDNTGLILVTHGAYGTGPAPMILGSQPHSAASFALVGGTIYSVAHADTNGILALLSTPGDHGVWWIAPDGSVTSLLRDTDNSPEPGEWSYAAGTLRVNIGGPLSGSFEVCARGKCVEVWTGTRFENLVFRYGMDGNFNLGCSNFRFEGCEFGYNADNGIDTGSNGSVGPGYFSRCRIHHNGRHGIYHHYTADTGFMHVEYCFIHDNGGHGILEDTYNNVEAGADWVSNCTISGNGGWGVYVENQGRTEYLKTYNTICIGNGSGEFFAPNDAQMFILSASNCVGPAGSYGGKWTQPAYQTSDLPADPLFLDASYTTVSGVWRVVDARLLRQSPCIDAGADLGLSRDLDGRAVPYGAAPDIGAFEYAPAALPHNGMDAQIDLDSVRLAQNPANGLALYVRQTANTLYLAVEDASRIITATDLVYIAFARQGVENRLTLPDNPATNPDYVTLSESAITSVQPWDAVEEGGGYLRFNYLDVPTSEFIGDATGVLGASQATGVIEIFLNRALNHLSTSSTFAWVVVVDPGFPSQIKASLPLEGVPADSRINQLVELLRIDGIVINSGIVDWRER